MSDTRRIRASIARYLMSLGKKERRGLYDQIMSPEPIRFFRLESGEMININSRAEKL